MSFPNQPAAQWIVEMVPERFQALTLDRIEPRSPEQADSIKAVQRYAEDIVAGGRHSLVLYGLPGGGKTMLAAAAWNGIAPQVAYRRRLSDVRDAGTADNVLWVRADRLIGEYWKCGEQADRRTAEERQYHLCTAGFAVLDDLDKHPSGTWAANLFGLIDARCACSFLPTVITMNSAPAELARKYGDYGAPIVDRLVRTGSLFVRVGHARG